MSKLKHLRSKMFGKQQPVNLTPPPKPEPRKQEELNKLYTEKVQAAGQASYQIFIQNRLLERINEDIKALVLEAAERQRLDTEKAAADAAKPAEVVTDAKS